GVKSESLEHADGDQPDEGSSFRILKRIRDPVPAIGGRFLSATFSLEKPARILPAGKINVFNPADHMETVIVFIPVFVLSRQGE
ncbi:hypothetical protein OSK51_29750, partial [Escherichia coli]|nr:hypothetical protein [Escherichia coli]